MFQRELERRSFAVIYMYYTPHKTLAPTVNFYVLYRKSTFFRLLHDDWLHLNFEFEPANKRAAQIQFESQTANEHAANVISNSKQPISMLQMQKTRFAIQIVKIDC